MEVSFFDAKNGSKTCSINKINLHSSYNPEKEAERFTETIQLNFYPHFILITEPALSYCANQLRKKFPDAKLLAVRYSNSFSESDKLWDKVFYFSEKNSLENELFNYLGEDGILCCLFLAWQASSNAFPKENQLVWEEIKNSVSKSSAILNTRTYFSKRWIKNSINFFSNIRKTLEISQMSRPVLVTASGRSLESSIKFIKKYRNDFFILAVSSSIRPLIKNKIIPDLCISTDGGYWAKKHLEILQKPEFSDIPLALTCEAACPSSILENRNILPLTYNDFLEKAFFTEMKISTKKVYRNGSVSGTAALLALELTDSNVYFCGLDMSENKGFQHTMPNALEETDCIKDFRLSTKYTRLQPREFHSDSMQIYRSWFASQEDSFSKRIFRISDNYNFSNKLGKIKDLNWNEYEKKRCRNITDTNTFQQNPDIVENNKKKVWSIIEKISTTSEWLKNAFPNDYLTFSRALENRQNIWNNLLKKNDDFLKIIKTRLSSDK